MRSFTVFAVVICRHHGLRCKKIYNEKVTLKKKFDLFFGIAMGLETNKESVSSTKIKIEQHETLQICSISKFATDPALDPCHLRGLSKTGTVT